MLERLRRSPATSALLAALVLAFAATAARPGLLGRFDKDNDLLRAEPWRLLTANFLHGGPVHLLVNAYALTMIGPTVERVYGAVRFWVVFLLGGVLGFVASALFVDAPSLGASAGLFALLGALLGFAVRARDRLVPAARRAMIREILTVAALNIGLGLAVPYVDNAAHVGGFAGGLALAFALHPQERDEPRRLD
ncbi:MAG TPA: rhomboid family intramembrane serine protease [Anaeromyxobacteraceae bacterium]|nr:rhomboid family intramembrane serine protease [Anaeromyxobacteraceae bacterium]